MAGSPVSPRQREAIASLRERWPDARVVENWPATLERVGTDLEHVGAACTQGATFTAAVLEYGTQAGFTGQGAATLTEYTAAGERPVELASTSPYAAMIDHVLACLAGHAVNHIEPASTLPALELTLDVHQRLAEFGG